MANYWALSAGLWNNVSNWLTGTSPGQMAGALPNSLDYVYTNGRIITVNVTTRVFAISNARSENSIEGGHFHLNSGVTLSAFVLGGGANDQYTVQFLSASPHQATIVGNLCAVNSNVATPGVVRHNGTGTLNVRGNFIPSRNNGGTIGFAGAFITNLSSGTLNLFGNYSGSLTPGTIPGIRNNGPGTINVLGNLSGLAINAGATACINHNPLILPETGVVNVTGNVVGAFIGTTPGAQAISVAFVNRKVNIVGNVFQNGCVSNSLLGVLDGPSSEVFIRGNCIGSGGDFGGTVVSNFGGKLTIVGNCQASNSRRNGFCIFNNTSLSSSVVNIYGNVNGGNAGSSRGIGQEGAGTINVYGNVTGGVGSASYGIEVRSGEGRVNVFGDSTGGPGTNAHGVFNNTGSTTRANIYVKRVVGNSWGSLAFVSEVPALSNLLIGNSFGFLNNSLSGLCYYSDLACGIRGNWPIGGLGPIYLSGSKDTKVSFPTDNFGPRVTTVALCANSNFNPAQRDVRENVDYEVVNGIPLEEDPDNPGLSKRYGTLRIPAPSLVAIGAPVDDTVGTATFENPEKIWDVLIDDPGFDGIWWDPIYDFEEWPTPTFRNTFNFTYGNRIRNAVTLNALSAVIKSLNNQPR
jgi:hypothetical protein